MMKIYKNKKNDFAILGLVFSIFAGIPGLVFSIIGLNQIKKTGQEGKGMCIAGIVISIVRIILVIGLYVVLIISLYGYSSIFDYDNMSIYEKCNSEYTYCDYSDYYCSEYGCDCTYDDGVNYDYFWCDSWNFDVE